MSNSYGFLTESSLIPRAAKPITVDASSVWGTHLRAPPAGGTTLTCARAAVLQMVDLKSKVFEMQQQRKLEGETAAAATARQVRSHAAVCVRACVSVSRDSHV